jgi:2,5-dihydroxypyridine 5,6-dioxygenase
MNPQTTSAADLGLLFRQEFSLCRVSPGETVVLLTDQTTSRDLVHAAFAAARSLDALVFEVCIPKTADLARISKASPADAEGVMKALLTANLVCTFFPPNLSRWLSALRASGGRILSIIASPDQLARLMSPPGLKEAVTHAADRYRNTQRVRVTSRAGTDLQFTRGRPGDSEVRGYYGYADEPGHFDQWGFGMVADFPDEGSAEGIVMIEPGDVWILPYVRMVESPIRLEIEGGHIRHIAGGVDARAFDDWLTGKMRNAEDLDPFAVSHLGFGLNPRAQWDHILTYGNSHDDLAVSMRSFAGNFLFSTGPGIRRKTAGHIDMPMCRCSVSFDGDLVVDEGRLVDPKMIVAG